MAISTGKAARKRHGTRSAAKAAKSRRRKNKTFGKLAYSVTVRKNTRPGGGLPSDFGGGAQ